MDIIDLVALVAGFAVIGPVVVSLI